MFNNLSLFQFEIDFAEIGQFIPGYETKFPDRCILSPFFPYTPGITQPLLNKMPHKLRMTDLLMEITGEMLVTEKIK